MRIALVSDTHFGDPMCSLASLDEGGNVRLGPTYARFKAEIGDPLDYLVMAGDVFDFSVASYRDAYQVAKKFFTALVKDGILKKKSGDSGGRIVYLPGNHDFEFWHQVEHEVNIIRKMHGGKPPRNFRWSVPGVFDLREGTPKHSFALPHVERRESGSEYGGLFLDSLTDGCFPFFVAYPNLYVLMNDCCILVTHGQYLEPYWAMLGELAPRIAGKDIAIGTPMDVRQTVAVNFPLNQLACSGVGQAGPLTELIRNIQREAKDREWGRVRKYLDNLDNNVLDKMADYGWANPREWVTDAVFNTLKTEVLRAIEGRKTTRHNTHFPGDKESRRRFKAYYRACRRELEELRLNYGYDDPATVPLPTHVIYGHTHVPIAWSNTKKHMAIDGTKVRFHNTGGWLFKTRTDAVQELEGAEIFFIEPRGIRSCRVS